MSVFACVAEWNKSTEHVGRKRAKARSSFSLWAVIINTDAVTLNAQAAFCHLCKHKEEVVTRLVIPSSRVILICTLVLQTI